MRITKFLVIVVISALGFGQSDPSNVNFTDIVPPAPSVAALMKLEEVPVNYYTGTPDISIPLYSEKLHERLPGIMETAKIFANKSHKKSKITKIIKYIAVFFAIIIGLSYAFGYDYLFKGIAKTYLRGENSATIDDAKLFPSNVVEAENPRIWLKDSLYNKQKLAENKEIFGKCI